MLDNGLIGPPLLHCGAGQIFLQFSTKRPFYGRIFLKGSSPAKTRKQNCEVKAGEACAALQQSDSAEHLTNKNFSRQETKTFVVGEKGSLCQARFPFDGSDEGCPAMSRNRMFNGNGSIQVLYEFFIYSFSWKLCENCIINTYYRNFNKNTCDKIREVLSNQKFVLANF